MEDQQQVDQSEEEEGPRVRAVAIKQEPVFGDTCPELNLKSGQYYGGIAPSWLDDFPWLEFVDSEHGGVCRICSEAGHDGQLTSTEHHDLLSHTWSIGHQEAEVIMERHRINPSGGARRHCLSMATVNGKAKSKRKTPHSKSPRSVEDNTQTLNASNTNKHEQQGGSQQRVRRFCTHWLTIYKWLEYNAQENAMYCTYCKRQKVGNNSFVIGSRCFKRDALRAHDGCKEHSLAVIAESVSNPKSSTTETTRNNTPEMSAKDKFLLGKLLKHYPWLLHNTETQVLICDTCQRHNINALYMDCAREGIDHRLIQQHLEGKRHQAAMDAEVESWHAMFDMGATAAEEEGENFQLEEVAPADVQAINNEFFAHRETENCNDRVERSAAASSNNVHYPSTSYTNTEDSTAIGDVEENNNTYPSLLPESSTDTCGVKGVSTTPDRDTDSNAALHMGLDSRLTMQSNMSPAATSMFNLRTSCKAGKIQPSFGKFKSEWATEFAWLHYDAEQDLMVCELCKKHKKKNTFSRGIRVFLRSFITHHIKSVKHRKAVEKEAEECPDSELLATTQQYYEQLAGEQQVSPSATAADEVDADASSSSSPQSSSYSSPEQLLSITALTPTGRVSYTDAVAADDESVGCPLRLPIAMAINKQSIATLSEQCQQVVNNALHTDNNSPRVIIPTTHNPAGDLPHAIYTTPHLRAAYNPEEGGAEKGMVVLEKKKDGSLYRRVRKFCSHWLQEYPWLVYDHSDDLMRCAVCVKHQRTSAFTKGTRTFHLDNIKKHEGSSGHQTAMTLEIV